MSSELTALARNNTWQLVNPPPNANIISCKWLFKIKCHADGTIARYKARLVAKGYTQEEGLDYFDTFSPVVKPTTIRTVLTIVLAQKWHIHQLDVNNASLHGELQEIIFMQQPPGFRDPLNSHKICLLNKALYGLKQAPRAWFTKLKTFLLDRHFVCSQSDNSLFIFTSHNIVLYLLVYVDDIIITGNQVSVV
jgi:Reverse transcriptase (RNA-dependent DNA polymerase)